MTVSQDKILLGKLSQGLTHKLSYELLRACESMSNEPLDEGFVNSIFKAICLRPYTTRFIAYDTEKDSVIAFVSLKKNGDRLFLIENFSVDSSYRNMGLGTRMLNVAFNLAKEEGGKKISLNVYRTNTKAQNLYNKLDFKEISPYIVTGQGNISESGSFRIVKRAILGHGFLTRLAIEIDGQINEYENNSTDARLLFEIYRDCVGKEWVDFFETNSINFMKGSMRIWHPPFYRNIFVNDQYDSFATVFNYPFSYKAMVELYSRSKTSSVLFLKGLLKVLARKGISYAHISVFKPYNTIIEWFRQKNMMTFEFKTMGKELK